MKKSNYRNIELLSIGFITYGLYIFSTLEYNLYEQKTMPNFYGDIDLMLVWGSFSFLYCALYYYLFLKKMVFKSQHWLVFLSLPLVIVLSNYYDKYVQDFMVLKLDFLPESVLKYHVKSYYNEKRIFTAMSYKLSRTFLALIGLAYLIKALEQARAIKTLKEQQLITELKYLKDKLNPHFFFNTLNNIYALALENSPKTPQIVSGLSKLMRYMLYESDKELVLLQREIEMMQEYVELERLRYVSAFNIGFEKQGINDKDPIPPLLFLPFIENAFKHGLENETENGFVEILFVKMGEELIFEVKNSLPKSERASGSGGIGLDTARKRLELLYGENFSLKVQENDTYTVQISIILGHEN